MWNIKIEHKSNGNTYMPRDIFVQFFLSNTPTYIKGIAVKALSIFQGNTFPIK